LFKSSTPLDKLLKLEKPLQLVGVINPLVALMAEQVGFNAIYLSGGGVACADLGLPDLSLTSLDDVLSQIRRITSITNLPLFVDADTGWGSPLNAKRSFAQISKAGAFGAHIEDQSIEKRCGHRDGKVLVSTQMMCSRIKAATDGRNRDDFVVIARTDALALEGPGKTIERAIAYQEAGADMIFVEAANDLSTYQTFKDALDIPILANMTEFGKTPLASITQLQAVGVDVVLYPLSAFRAMNLAALTVLKTIREQGSQEACLDMMQTREALYKTINYDEFEKTLDDYLMKEREHG
jgi:methylisocitrate lyase